MHSTLNVRGKTIWFNMVHTYILFFVACINVVTAMTELRDVIMCIRDISSKLAINVSVFEMRFN